MKETDESPSVNTTEEKGSEELKKPVLKKRGPEDAEDAPDAKKPKGNGNIVEYRMISTSAIVFLIFEEKKEQILIDGICTVRLQPCVPQWIPLLLGY